MRRRTFLGAIGAGLLAGQGRGRPTETLAYVMQDGLWLQALPEGRPVQIAGGNNLGSPKISPSGAWILHHRGDTVWVAASDGSRTSQLGNGKAEWRPGYDEAVLQQEEGLSFFAASNRWAGPVRSIPDAELPVVYSPDGSELVYGERTDADEGLLRRASADGTGTVKTVVSRTGDGLEPYAWLGDSLLYWVDEDFSGSAASDGLELFRVPSAGGEPKSLGVKTLLNEDFLSLSPDGGRLAVADGWGRQSWSRKRIAVLDWTSGDLHYLTDENTAAISPSWSPDGSRIAYSAVAADKEGLGGGEPARRLLANRRISVADASENKPPVQLTSDKRYRDEEPIWLADGRHILFCRIERGSGEDDTQTVWMMDAASGAAEQVAGPLYKAGAFEGESWFGYYGTIHWSDMMDYHRGRRTS
jgi:WD40-like Beta Propeller Repeat